MLGGPWGSLGVIGTSWGDPWDALGDLGGSLRRPWEYLGALGGSLEAHAASCEGLRESCGALGIFWKSMGVLGCRLSSESGLVQN